MLEWIVILGTIFCIIVWYYSQSVSEYSFSQITEKQVPLQLLDLWSERKPVIVSEARTSDIWSGPSLRRTRFWGAQPVWETYEGNPQALVPQDHALQKTWAEILGIGTLEHERLIRWFDVVDWLYSTRTEAHIGPEGLRQVYGWATAVTVTDGEGRCVLLHSAQKNKMPPGWKGLRWSHATVEHHPLWTQVQFIEIILRPGTTLLVPPHWIVAVEPLDESKPLWWTRTDLHHPVSRLAQRINGEI